MRKIIIHNHLPRRVKDEDTHVHAMPRDQEERNRDKFYKDTGIRRVNDNVTINRGKLDEDGIAEVDVLKDGKTVGTGFWDTHASAFWIRPKGGSEKMFRDRSEITKFFEKANDGGPGSGPQPGGGGKKSTSVPKGYNVRLGTGGVNEGGYYAELNGIHVSGPHKTKHEAAASAREDQQTGATVKRHDLSVKAAEKVWSNPKLSTEEKRTAMKKIMEQRRG